jgi:putative beta-lysine N-acetyltransferase
VRDKIEKFGKGSFVQHGKLNNRVYLMKLKKPDFPKILPYIENLIRSYSYTKVFCKVPYWAVPILISEGFIIEAQIPGFYDEKDDVFFMSKFLDNERFSNKENEQLELLAQELIASDKNVEKTFSSDGFSSAKLKKDDVTDITTVYKKVFKTYPFPIFNTGYILKTMKENVDYFGIKANGKLIALSSAEIDKEGRNAEMTDFATLPKFRGKSLATMLLIKMEIEMKEQNINTLYTIARLNSIAMNKTFLKLNYKYAGTLVNNTNIAGEIESMNVYYKHL